MAGLGAGDRAVNWSLEDKPRARPGRRAAVFALLAPGLGALAFAVKHAEDNQLFSSNVVSWGLFVLSGLCAYWALLALMILCLKYLKKRRK